MLQGLDPRKRAVSRHVLYESQSWVAAFNVALSVASTVADIVTNILPQDSPLTTTSPEGVDWCTALTGIASSMTGWAARAYPSPPLLVRHASPCAALLCSHEQTPSYVPCTPQDMAPFGFQGSALQFVVAKEPVSYHFPMHRFFGILCARLASTHNLDPAQAIPDVSADTARALLYPLRAMVLYFQVWKGMWRRNGASTQNELHNYAGRITSTFLLDADRAAVQVRNRGCSAHGPFADCSLRCWLCVVNGMFCTLCAALVQTASLLMPKETFLGTVLTRFDVLHDLFGDTPRLTSEAFVAMVEATLRFLIEIVTELPMPSLVGVDVSSGTSPPELQSMRRTLVHFLASKNHTHSELNAYVAAYHRLPSAFRVFTRFVSW